MATKAAIRRTVSPSMYCSSDTANSKLCWTARNTPIISPPIPEIGLRRPFCRPINARRTTVAMIGRSTAFKAVPFLLLNVGSTGKHRPICIRLSRDYAQLEKRVLPA